VEDWHADAYMAKSMLSSKKGWEKDQQGMIKGLGN